MRLDRKGNTISRHIRSNVIGYMALFVALSGTAYAVDGPLPGQNQVGSADIIDDEVTSADVQDATRDETGIAAVDLAANSVGSSEVATSAVGSGEVAPDSLAAADLAPGAIGSSELAANTIDSASIIDGQVTHPDLGANAVTGGNVFPSSLSGADIQASSLTTSDVAADTLTSSDIAAAGVGSSEVANESLTTSEFASSIPAVAVTRGSTIFQGIPHNSHTTLNFSSERYDTANLHSNTSNRSRLTAPVAGIYAVTAHVYWASNGSGYRSLSLRGNGSTGLGGGAHDELSASGGGSGFNDPYLNLTAMARLDAGDYVEAVAYQTSGGTLSVRPQEFAMTWMAPGP